MSDKATMLKFLYL